MTLGTTSPQIHNEINYQYFAVRSSSLFKASPTHHDGRYRCRLHHRQSRVFSHQRRQIRYRTRQRIWESHPKASSVIAERTRKQVSRVPRMQTTMLRAYWASESRRPSSLSMNSDLSEAALTVQASTKLSWVNLRRTMLSRTSKRHMNEARSREHCSLTLSWGLKTKT